MKWTEVRVLPFMAIFLVILLYWIDTDPGYNDALKTGRECMYVTLFVLIILLVLYVIFCGARARLRFLIKNYNKLSG